jgi:hypothetical protein
VSKAARPVAVQKKATAAPGTPRWVWGVYYALAAYWMLEGLYQVVSGLLPAFQGKDLAVFGVVGAALGLFSFLVGLGLAVNVDLARGVVNFFAGLRIIFGLFSLAGAVMGSVFAGLWGFLLVVLTVLDIAVAALTIYIIGETETRMPNV